MSERRPAIIDHPELDQQILNSIFRPVAAALQQDIDHPVFFLSLVPDQWKVRYFGLALDNKPENSSRLFEETISSVKTAIAKADKPAFESLDEAFENLRSRKLLDRTLTGRAINFLSNEEVALGWTNSSVAGGSWGLDCDDEAPQVWFQAALDWAACEFNKERFLGVYKGKALAPLEHKRALHVDNYVQRQGIINAVNAGAFLAEAVLCGGFASEKNEVAEKPSALNHWFVPIQGLGQWRAAACWIASLKKDQTQEPGLYAVIDELLSQAIIDVFAEQFGDAVVVPPTQNDRYKRIADALSLLWWSEEICLYWRGENVFRLCRDSVDKALKQSEPTPSRFWLASRGFIKVEKVGQFHRIHLAFQCFKPEHVRLLGFDRVTLTVRLLNELACDQPASKMEKYGENIRGRIESRLEQLTLRDSNQQALLRAEIEDAAVHTIKNAITTMGWRHALSELSRIFSRITDPEIAAAVIEARSVLAKLRNPEAIGSLLRLRSLVETGKREKLKYWTAYDLLERWKPSQELLELYRNYIKNFAAQICVGMSYEKTIAIGIDGAGSEQIDLANLQADSMEEWYLGPLIPLSFSGGDDSHIALLATLIEPLSNAIKATSKCEVSPAIFIRLFDHLPDYVLVRIENWTLAPPDRLPPGVLQLQEILKKTRMASIPDKPWRDRNYWGVEVKLHPHKLAEWILERKADSGDR
jgi:hypothetical protein